MEQLFSALHSEGLWTAVGALAAVAAVLVAWLGLKKDTGRSVDELPTEKVFVESQVSAIGEAKVSVALCLHTVSASDANPKARRINAALVGAKNRGVVVRVLAGNGESQFPGAHELQEKNGIDVCLNPELLHSDLRFLKVDADVVVLGVAEATSVLPEYTPSQSWALLKTVGLSDALEREFQRLWLAPASRDLYTACSDYIAPLQDRIPMERLAVDIKVRDLEFIRRLSHRLNIASLTDNSVFIFHGKACAGKSTLMRELTRFFGGRRLDLLTFVLPLVFRHGNDSVVGDRIRGIYGDVLSHLATVSTKVSYDLIETGAEFPDSILPGLFQHLKTKGKTPVLIHCCLPFPVACSRNEQRSRPVPSDVLDQQHKDEEGGLFREICKDSGVNIFEVKTTETIKSSLEKLTDFMKGMALRGSN